MVEIGSGVGSGCLEVFLGFCKKLRVGFEYFEGLGGIVVGKKGHIGFEFSSAHVADSA